MRLLSAIFLIAIISTAMFSQTSKPFTIEGHRGARGHLPENTIPSFIKAIELGADTLELDVVITSDEKVLVSHDAWFVSLISLDPKGNPISKEDEQKHNIYKMKYAEVKKYEVGSIGNANFPDQQKMKVHKPLLADVFKAVDKYLAEKKLPPVRYNIEIKVQENGDGIFQPEPQKYVGLVYSTVKKANKLDRVIIQSFDPRPLQVLRKLDAKVPIAMLVGNNKKSFETVIKELGFTPDTYSPHFSLVNADLMAKCRERNIKVVPWTVNEIADLERMKTFDLDGIISDYPDRAVKVFKK